MFDVIPAIDLIDGRCVRLEQGDFSRETIYDCEPAETGKKWASLGAPLIHVVDLQGAKSGSVSNLPTIEAICRSAGVPCELGGGVRSAADIRALLNAGVARVVMGTTLAENPEYAREIVDEFGRDKIVAGLDGRNGRVAVRGWVEESAVEICALAKTLFAAGVYRFIYTDIATDGMFTGPNIQGIDQLCRALPDARIIASGGVGVTEHVAHLVSLRHENLEGVIVGKALYDGRLHYRELTQIVHGSRHDP